MRTLLAMMTTAAIAHGTAEAAAGASERGGVVESDLITIEVLSPRGEREIRTPEGYIRVESDGVEDSESHDQMGSFGTYHAAALDTPPSDEVPAGEAPVQAAPVRRDGMIDTAAPRAGPDPCRDQRRRYLRRMLQMTGIDVALPLELLDGLAGPGMPGGNLLVSGYFVPGLDAVRPLAWDMELRSIGRDLAACESSVRSP